MDDSKTTMTDVEKFVRFCIRFGGIYTTDADGYVINRVVDDEDERPVLIKFGSTYKRPMVLKEKISDKEVAVINPLNENVAESQEFKWLYTMWNSGLVLRFIHLLKFVSNVVETSNDGKADELGLSHDVISFISKHKDFDKKAYEHFRLVAKDHAEFMRVWYHRKTKDSRFRCSIYNTDTHVAFPQVTNKSWKALISIISDILGVSKDMNLANEQIEERFFVTSDLLTVPRLESTLMVYSRLYSRINKYLEMVNDLDDDEDFVVDISELDMHIIKLPEYYKKAKWFNSGTYTAGQSKTGINTLERTTPGMPSSGIPSNPMVSGRATYAPSVVEEPGSNIPSNPRRLRGSGDIEYATPIHNPHGHGIQYAQPRMVQPQFGGQMGGFGMPTYQQGIPLGGGMQPSGIPINPQLGGGGGFRF